MNERVRRILLRIRDRLWGPMGSVVFHVALLVLVLQFAASQAMEKSPKVEVVLMTPEATKLDDVDKTIEKEIEKVETPPPDTVVTPPPDVPVMANPEPEGWDRGVGSGGGERRRGRVGAGFRGQHGGGIRVQRGARAADHERAVWRGVRATAGGRREAGRRRCGRTRRRRGWRTRCCGRCGG